MSAQLKVFFDRLSSCDNEKIAAKAREGKEISVLATGYGQELPECFIEPFKLTADYMNLVFRGFWLPSVDEDEDLARVHAIFNGLVSICTNRLINLLLSFGIYMRIAVKY